MDNTTIRDRAQTYVTQEQNSDFRSEVERLLSDESGTQELADRFYTDLEFGTGGLRGVIGGGYNRMNTFVIRRATTGLARYVSRFVASERGENAQPSAVIAYDCRRYSDVFALEAARVLCSHGIKTYLFSGLRPTPELSFAVRTLGADTGIVVTASHNPPQYNGYKVYWNDGSQVVAPHDTGIIGEVQAVTDIPGILTAEDAQKQGLLEYIDSTIDDQFIDMVVKQVIRPELFTAYAASLGIVYTPLHGTGAMLMERVFEELGISIDTVPSQRMPDGEFPTVKSPNPEEGEALKAAIEQAKETGAELVLGTDPDSDRLGIAVRSGENDFTLITGNQLGVLLADYILGSLAALDRLPEKPAFVKTIVTTELQRVVAEHHGAQVFDTLTGFKHIAALIRSFEANPGTWNYVMGDEESYGYMIGTEVRDKDAITAAVLTTEMALYHESTGSSVLKRLHELYEQFGYYEERTISAVFPGQDGIATMKGLMEQFRSSPPTEWGGEQVVALRDYQRRITRSIPDGEEEQNIDLPSSNVLQFELLDGSRVSVRPSGTEPKIKFYASVRSAPGTPVEQAREAVQARLERIEAAIHGYIPEA